jgi:cation:H+ antiporter
LIGILILGLGTTAPELSFSLKAVKRHDDSLAVGDILGTVLADVTIALGMLALITPFSFPQEIVLVTGTFMILSSFMLFYFMESGRRITKREGRLLILIWATFALVSLFVNH